MNWCKWFGHKWVPVYCGGKGYNFIGTYCSRCDFGHDDLSEYLIKIQDPKAHTETYGSYNSEYWQGITQ